MANIKFNKIIRTEAVAVVLVLVSLFIVYYAFFMEFHLKKILEKAAFESIGSEVNISKLNVDVLKSSLRLDRVQITDPDQPKRNLFEIKRILVTYSFSDLLSGVLVSDMTNVIGIKFHSERSSEGRVLSKDKRLINFKDPSNQKIDDTLRGKYKELAFSDLVSLFKKDDLKDLEKKYKEKLASVQISKKIETKVKNIKSNFSSLEDFKDRPEVEGLLKELKAFKFKSGSSKETLDSTNKSLALIKKIKSTKSKLKNEIGALKSEVSAFKKMVKSSPQTLIQDFADLKKDFDVGQLSPDKISESILSEYFSVQFNQIGRVTESVKSEAALGASDYVDLSKIPEKREASKNDVSTISLEKKKEAFYKKHSKEYIFYKDRAQSQYWFKKINIRSSAEIGQDLGDVTGYILDLSKEPSLTGKPIKVHIDGSAPKHGVGKFKIRADLDHVNPSDKKEKVTVDVSDYLLEGLKLLDSDDALLKVLKANSQTALNINKSNAGISLNLNQILKAPDYSVKSKDKNIQLVLNEFKSLKPDLTMNLKAEGSLKSPQISIKSNIGNVLLKILTSGVKKKADALINKKMSMLNDTVKEKLNPYVKDVDLLSLKSGDLEKNLTSKLDAELGKLKQSKKQEVKQKAKKALKKLFDRL